MDSYDNYLKAPYDLVEKEDEASGFTEFWKTERKLFTFNADTPERLLKAFARLGWYAARQKTQKEMKAEYEELRDRKDQKIEDLQEKISNLNWRINPEGMGR